MTPRSTSLALDSTSLATKGEGGDEERQQHALGAYRGADDEAGDGQHGVDEDEERHAAQDVDDGAERKVYGAVGSEPILGGDGEDEAERQTDDIGEEGDGDGHVWISPRP